MQKCASEKRACLLICNRWVDRSQRSWAMGTEHPGQGPFGAGPARCSLPVTRMEMYRIQRFDIFAADRSGEEHRRSRAALNPDIMASLWAVVLNLRKRTSTWVQAQLLRASRRIESWLSLHGNAPSFLGLLFLPERDNRGSCY